MDRGAVATGALESTPEQALAQELRWLKLTEGLQREHRFAPPRRWRFDFAWPSHQLAVEVEGGTWTGGRHTTGVGFENDCEKYNTAVALGWRVLRVTPKQIHQGEAVAWIESCLLPG